MTNIEFPNRNGPAAVMRRTVAIGLSAVDALTKLDGWLGALCLLLLTGLMIAGMVTRALSTVVSWLPRDLPIAWEYSSYLMAATFTFGSALTLRGGGHIRVRILLGSLGHQSRRCVELVIAIIAGALGFFLATALLDLTLTSYSLSERSIASNTPLWIPQAVVSFGLFLVALQFVARLLRAVLDLPLEETVTDPRESGLSEL